MDVFNVNKIFISSFLNGLWNHPEIIYHIINDSELDIVKNNLAPFICHNFFCNHLSGNYIENNLLYIIAMMLRDEIDKLESVDQVDKFLENTKCGYLLGELIKVPDIQIYFNRVIIKTVEKIERNYSFREIKFNVQDILKEFMKIKEDEKKKNKKKEEKNLDEHYRNIINRKLVDLSINYSKEDNDNIHDGEGESVVAIRQIFGIFLLSKSLHLCLDAIDVCLEVVALLLTAILGIHISLVVSE